MYSKLMNLIRMIPAGFYYGLIWMLSCQHVTANLHGFDKTIHIIEYSGLGFWLAFGLGLNQEDFDYKATAALLFGALAGISDELHQLFVPTRSCDPMDFAADMVGISLGILVLYGFIRLLSFLKDNLVTKKQSEQAF